MENNIEPGKLFVGGLSWETTKENLEKHFQQFGELDTDNCVIMKEPATGRPRGFGFVQFKDPNSVGVTLASGPHILDKKTIDPKQATAKGAPTGNSTTGKDATISRKVFLGGLPNQVDSEEIKAVFSRFGTVMEVDLKMDKATNRMRGFGFVAFDSEESARIAVKEHFVPVLDKKVEVKMAEPREKSSQTSIQGGQYCLGTVHSMQGQYANFSYPAGYHYPTAQQPQYSGTTSGQYAAFPPSGYAHNSQQYPAGYGAAAAAAQRYPYEYTAAGQQHGYPQDTSSYGTAANPTGYTNEAYSNAAAGYGYTTDQTNSYHHYHDQSTGVASTAGYPARAAQTQQRVTAGAYNNFGATR